jgi:hypothetical protein
MSKSSIWHYNEFIQTRKEKLVNMLISEIIFLKKRFKEAKNKEEIEYLGKALNKLDYLLNMLKNNSSDIAEDDFDKILMLIYQIFKEIAKSLE